MNGDGWMFRKRRRKLECKVEVGWFMHSDQMACGGHRRPADQWKEWMQKDVVILEIFPSRRCYLRDFNDMMHHHEGMNKYSKLNKDSWVHELLNSQLHKHELNEPFRSLRKKILCLCSCLWFESHLNHICIDLLNSNWEDLTVIPNWIKLQHRKATEKL